jgi:tetratricopeptide (TPR) repeat protein
LQAKLAAPARPSTAAPVVAPKTKRKTTSLVFLDLDEPAKAKAAPGRPTSAQVRPVAPPVGVPPVAPKAPSPAPAALPVKAVSQPIVAPPAPPVAPPSRSAPPAGEVEVTHLGDDVAADEVGPLDGLELTGQDFGQVRDTVARVESIRDEHLVGDAPPLAGLEPTAPAAEETIEAVPLEEVPLVEAFEVDETEAFVEEEEASLPVEELVTPRPSEPGKRKTVVEIPPLELEPDFDGALETTTTSQQHEVDDEPLVIDDAMDAGKEWLPLGESATTESDLKVEKEGEQAEAIVFEGLAEEAPAVSTIGELEARVADEPDDAEAHQALGEALIEAGERDRGIEELDIATSGFETAGNLDHAQGLVDEILRLDPNSVRHRQKQVEFAFKAADKPRLIGAYLELADTLLRTDLADKARAVYERVVEHDPTNERARAALSMLAPAPEPPKQEGRVAPKDAKMRVRDETSDEGDFVDLGAMILEEEAPRDTRMKVEDEEPTGDEEQDFREMLARFRQGIDENIEETDFQSHYDLGVAFKEMGLLDEAIAEFQKALRAPDGKLRTSESLGVCFFEKGASVVAESILRRALELPSSGDQERLGILYWLGRALEEQGKQTEARELYGRVFAVDIRFMDVGARVKALAKAH